MSVKIRLNNKRFLGESLLIGSRLNEGEVQQPAANGQTTAQPAAPATGQVAQPAAPANGQPTTPTAAPANNANAQNANGQG